MPFDAIAQTVLALDANSFNAMGNNHLVQNNFGRRWAGPLGHHKTFFFINYEGLRHTMANTMIDTVPTDMEAMADFSLSGTTIYVHLPLIQIPISIRRSRPAQSTRRFCATHFPAM